MIPDEKSHLRKAEHDLYVTDIVAPKSRAAMHGHATDATDAPEDWHHDDQPTIHTMKHQSEGSLFKKIFLGSIGILAVALAIFAISFFSSGSISADRVDVAITTRAFVDGGESLPVDVTITNNNRAGLELAKLVLQYPASNAGNADAMARIERDLPDVSPGDSHRESFTIQLYGEEGSAKQITAHIEFHVVGSNAVYDKDESEQVTVRTSPVRLTLDAPASVLPNQVVPLKFSITGNGTATLPNTAMKIEYPAGFTFSSASPAPSLGNNVWYLGDVPPGANRAITVHGSFTGSVNDAITLRASVGSQNAKNENQLDQVYSMVSQVIPLTNAFIDAKITVGSGTGAVVPVGATENTRVEIPWTNTTASSLTNIEIRVALSGSAYDPARVQPGNGFFNSQTNEIIWTRQQESDLASADPGKSGTVSFSIVPKSGVSGSAPSIVATVSVKAIESGTVRTAANIDKKTLAVGSDLNLLARTIYYSGPIQNTGVMPPKHDTETTYTIEWQLTNSRNRVTGARVSTQLPTNVAWKNVIVPAGETVSYNTVTRELVWNAGEISAGITKTVSMKIGITPSSAQVGGTAPITDTITVIGRDTFTNTDLGFTKRGLDTRTQNDGPGAGDQGQVQ